MLSHAVPPGNEDGAARCRAGALSQHGCGARAAAPGDPLLHVGAAKEAAVGGKASEADCPTRWQPP